MTTIGDIKHDSLLQEMSHVKDDCAMLRAKKTQLERETETLRQQQFLEKDELEREIETMREEHSSDKTTLERTIETMQQRESVQKTNREREIEAMQQQDLVHRKQLKEDMKEVGQLSIAKVYLIFFLFILFPLLCGGRWPIPM